MDIPYGYCQCGCGNKTAVATINDTNKRWIKGEPKRFLPNHHLNISTPSPEERFWSQIDKSGDCWTWTGRKDKAGYGMMSIKKKGKRCNRFSWEIHHGPIPRGLYVCHSCDNPSCVNPAHLFLGNDADNMHDMIAKGRNKRIGKKGETHHMAKLTEQLVLDIRSEIAKDKKQYELAKQFNVGRCTISLISTNKIWRHI